MFTSQEQFNWFCLPHKWEMKRQCVVYVGFDNCCLVNGEILRLGGEIAYKWIDKTTEEMIITININEMLVQYLTTAPFKFYLNKFIEIDWGTYCC